MFIDTRVFLTWGWFDLSKALNAPYALHGRTRNSSLRPNTLVVDPLSPSAAISIASCLEEPWIELPIDGVNWERKVFVTVVKTVIQLFTTLTYLQSNIRYNMLYSINPWWLSAKCTFTSLNLSNDIWTLTLTGNRFSRFTKGELKHVWRRTKIWVPVLTSPCI